MKHLLKILILSLLFGFVSLYAEGQEKPHVVPIDSDGVQRVLIVAGSYYFKPEHIIVKVNIPVEVIISKEAGIVPHNFVIKDPEADIEMNEPLSTKQKAIKFTSKKVGKYQFYCDKRFLFFKSHREKGMNGILEVIE